MHAYNPGRAQLAMVVETIPTADVVSLTGVAESNARVVEERRGKRIGSKGADPKYLRERLGCG